MTTLNYTKNRVALLLGGSITEKPYAYMIGIGSSIVSVTDTTLVIPTDRQSFTTITYPSSQKVKFQTDWNSVEISGTQLSEFGLVGSATGTTGSMWSRSVIPSLTFDGTNELRIEETLEVY